MSGTPLLSPGVVIAETYEIERQLGRGGMGEVWLARHRRLAGKQVAIKVLHIDRDLPAEALARFKREAEIAARLEHPNIVQVLDFNTLPTGQPYLVMEFLKGQSLAARAAGRPVPVEVVLNVMQQVGSALQAAHKAGVVHRDLKPENIFLVPTALGDQVKVLDFGISKLSDSNTVQTTEAVLIGTPLYMSPEQAQGHNSEVGAQSDLFSLGSITYELLTGAAPFVADNIAKVVFRIAYEKHAPLANAVPDAPPSVVKAVEHALEKKREHRTPTIEAFVLELTGKALADVSSESSGVFTPNVPVTSSMISGETRAPSSPRIYATPNAPGVPSPPPEAPTISGRKFVIITVVAVLALGGVVTRVRMDNWADRAAYRAAMIDAGWTLQGDGNLTRDAGVVAAVVVDAGAPLVAEVVDAGEVDAGAVAVVAPIVDAGVAPKQAHVEVALPPDEQAELTRLRADLAAGRFESLWDTRTPIRLRFKSAGGKRQMVEFFIELACARADNQQVKLLLNEYRGMPGASLRTMKQTCLKRYPAAADLDW